MALAELDRIDIVATVELDLDRLEHDHLRVPSIDPLLADQVVPAVGREDLADPVGITATVLACMAMDGLTDDDARALLGLPMAYVLPAAEVLVAEARRIVETNLALASAPSVPGRVMSPIWERKGSRAAVRAVRLPGEFSRRYFTGGGRMVLGKAGVRTLVAGLMPWMAEDLRGAAAALEDTLELWTFEDEPLQLLESPYGGHYKLLSLMLADIARKADAGLDTLDWIASLGLPVEEFCDDDDPPASEIHARMEERMDAMWAQEDAWLDAKPG